MHATTLLETVGRDLRHALRTIAKTPAFAAAAVITIALGIGANTAVFSVIRAVLLRPLEFQDPDRLVFISVDNPKQNPRLNEQFSLDEFDEMRAGARSFLALGAYDAHPENISLSTGRSEPEALKAARVSANFLDVLELRPILGRSFLPEEDQRGGPDVVMISAELWKRRFGSDPALAGKTAILDAKLFTIIGVLPPGFEFPFDDVDAWLPRPSEWSVLPPRFWSIPLLNGFARRRGRCGAFAAYHHEQSGHRRECRRATASWPGAAADCADPVLLAVVGLYGMTAYSVAQRTQEVGIRRALGADEGDILRLVLRQSLITVAAGVIAGSAAALALTRVLRDFLFHVSATEPAVFIGIAALFIAIASLASLIPARRAVRVDPMTALRIS